jgi:hypothetical protein
MMKKLDLTKPYLEVEWDLFEEPSPLTFCNGELRIRRSHDDATVSRRVGKRWQPLCELGPLGPKIMKRRRRVVVAAIDRPDQYPYGRHVDSFSSAKAALKAICKLERRRRR